MVMILLVEVEVGVAALGEVVVGVVVGEVVGVVTVDWKTYVSCNGHWMPVIYSWKVSIIHEMNEINEINKHNSNANFTPTMTYSSLDN